MTESTPLHSPFTSPLRGKRYTADDFRPYVKQYADWDSRVLQLLPNLEPIQHSEFINATVHLQLPRLAGQILNPNTNESYWGTLYLRTLQGGGWDGSGYVGLAHYGLTNTPYTARFALCKHQNQYLPSSHPERGLHDQFCVLCGLDTSVDSSD